MMLKRFLVAAALLIAACQPAPPMRAPLASPTPVIVTPTPSLWLQVQINGVTLGMWQPSNWEVKYINQGLILAEPTVQTNDPPASNGGMLILCSVPRFKPSDDSELTNYALMLLQQIVHASDHDTWDMVGTEPTAFAWDGDDAAYYLFTTGEGVRALVIAVTVPGQKKVVFCTISVPTTQVALNRAQVGQLLDGMTINTTILHGSGLSSLPDRLPFPRYMPPAGTPQATASSTAQP